MSKMKIAYRFTKYSDMCHMHMKPKGTNCLHNSTQEYNCFFMSNEGSSIRDIEIVVFPPASPN